MFLADGSVSIAFNGEIYNYRKLQEELIQLGHTFQTGSDTEVLLRAYKEWSTDMLSRLDGMFAFVIYDWEHNVHFAARDPMGVKPLYKSGSKNFTFFASEIKALLQCGGEIREILPGHYEFGEKEGQYFKFKRQALNMSDQQIVDHFKVLFEQAIAKRVQTDLPIAMIFSGGIDSSAVLGFALRHHPNITAITMGFKGSPDLEFAKRFCKERGIKQIIQELDLDELKADLPEIVFYAETFEPVDIIDGVLMSVAYKKAHDLGFKLVLTGDGSDEYLAGYDLFKQSSDPEKLMEYRLANLYRTDLQRLDRCTMRYQIEARSPFMDKSLIQFGFNIPMRLKIKDGVEKWILREACKDVLPDYLRTRRKIRTSQGTGLLYQIKDYTVNLQSDMAPEILENLQIQNTESDTKYYLSKYMEFGYPLPKERFKKPGLDFHKDGFFIFENLSPNHPEWSENN
jgi:asparagine synthase (glutamine-hydrolysing)